MTDPQKEAALDKMVKNAEDLGLYDGVHTMDPNKLSVSLHTSAGQQAWEKERQQWREVILDALKMLDGTIWYQKHKAIIEPLRNKFR